MKKYIVQRDEIGNTLVIEADDLEYMRDGSLRFCNADYVTLAILPRAAWHLVAEEGTLSKIKRFTSEGSEE